MIDFDLIIGFDWDLGNSRKRVDRHDVSQGEAEQLFFNQPLLLLFDRKHSPVEQRLHALGHTDDGRFLHLTFTLRNNRTLIRVISARDINRKERAIYGEGA